MADYNFIKMSFWTDAKIVDDFTPEDKYFYLYLLTNAHTNICGCYPLSIRQMSTETGYSQEVVEKLLLRLANQHDVIRYSKDTKEVLLVNYYKHNWTTSEKYLKGVEKSIEGVKDAEFKRFLTEILYGIDRVCIPYTYPMDRVSFIYNNINNNTLKDNDTDRDNDTDNNLDTDKEKPIKSNKDIEIEELFESLWSLYPKKRHKEKVSKKSKKEIYKIGREKMELAIERYKKERYGKDSQFTMHGSTFFNGGYKDYLEDTGEENNSGFICMI